MRNICVVAKVKSFDLNFAAEIRESQFSKMFGQYTPKRVKNGIILLQWWRPCSHDAFQVKGRRIWVNPLLRRRDRGDEFHLVMKEFKLNPGRFWLYFRMSGHFDRRWHPVWEDRAAASKKLLHKLVLGYLPQEQNDTSQGPFLFSKRPPKEADVVHALIKFHKVSLLTFMQL